VMRDPMDVAGDLVRLKGRHHALMAEACHCIQRLIAERDLWQGVAKGLMESVERLRDHGPLSFDDVVPVLDVLPRLWGDGFKTRMEIGGRWGLVSRDGVVVCSGESFRALCVNVLLAGL